jgi:ATP-dependent DNA helicase DinG
VSGSYITLPDAPIVVAGTRRVAIVTPDGEIEELDLPKARRRLSGSKGMIVAHAPALARRLELPDLQAFDLLELYAFCQPASACLPTPRGLAQALGLVVPRTLTEQAMSLRDAAIRLLQLLAATGDGNAAAIAHAMGEAGWSWAPFVAEALSGVTVGKTGMAVWRDLPEISEHAPEPPAGHKPVTPDQARARLAKLLDDTAEARPSQADYASTVTHAFQPREQEGQPRVVLAEAGTGVGKTLGYLAPSVVWAEQNQGAVWISTYTRNLQHQLDSELDKLYPDPTAKVLKSVLRKGRENYLCLLNFEEAVQGLGVRKGDAVALGLMARWAAATRDGDLSGGDFPGWLPELIGRGRTQGLADRRGECIYAACQHFNRCYIERGIRRARRAEIVVANHALVMVQAALGDGDGGALPSRLVFDEGHHLFDAADNAFSSALSGVEGSELRRWLLGSEASARSRSRGLKRRIEDLVADENGAKQLDDALKAARALPGEGWAGRLRDNQPNGAVEQFLTLVRAQVLARSDRRDEDYRLETDVSPAIDGLVEAGAEAATALDRLVKPLFELRQSLLKRLVDEAAELDTATRQRIEAISRSLMRRAIVPLGGWIAMLKSLDRPTPDAFVDWLALDRRAGNELDVGMERHWIDPTVPLIESLNTVAHGIVVTSATLTDGTGDVEADWRAAEQRTGAVHLAAPAIRAGVPSPFDYPNNTRVFIVTDVRKDDLGQVASAYRELFLASGGGALGLFTAISRLRAVHAGLIEPLDEAGIQLLAQHVDAMGVTSLIDIFRAEEDACLLGTDAVRDGVDVPGRSLRLIVFDRVPWPRPDILHRARKAAFGGKTYDDMLTRLKLKQAFGRLVRRADDRGVFALLDPMMPSRLLGAFPPGVTIERVGIKDAVAATREFFHPGKPESACPPTPAGILD